MLWLGATIMTLMSGHISFHSTCAMSASSKSSPRLLLYLPSPSVPPPSNAYSRQVTHFFFLARYLHGNRQSIYSTCSYCNCLARKHRGNTDMRYKPHLYKSQECEMYECGYWLFRQYIQLLKLIFKRPMFCFSAPRDPSSTLRPSGRESGN